ncbi:TPM domain-containing protein [Sphingomonas lycopersici]|uniref:TPM domain-containing protein n=1 Tax=Sphingomonas lycopersici TaxID=2951807 RepID=A0AA42CTS6_9SPHN|nr:TPM domain-containing protein [Sphingomonas lycopersici]MCW6534693.1 TPM domain-containing protein [Sphingomonas lycopersici]
MRMTAAERDSVTAAVTAAEAGTDGEIVTVVARSSDAYHDVALHWTMLAMLLAIALLAAFPLPIERLHQWLDPWAPAVPINAVLTIALFVLVIVFLVCRVVFAWRPLRLALTPRATKARRVRARALAIFRAAAEKRTIGATGVLLYLSLDEHRAEIIADAAIHDRVPDATWGAAMAALIGPLKQGRAAEGMAAAVTQIGLVLAEHFPRTPGDTNELPDRLITL